MNTLASAEVKAFLTPIGCWRGCAGRVPHPHALGRKEPNAPVEWGQDIRTIQELLGHKDVQITMIYTHVLNRGPLGVTSAADLL